MDFEATKWLTDRKMVSPKCLALWLSGTLLALVGFYRPAAALEPETELVRSEIAGAAADLMQRFVAERWEKDSSRPSLTVSLSFSKSGRRPPPQSDCQQRLERQFEEQIATLHRDTGLQLKVTAAGSATIAFVIEDMNGPRANPFDVPWQAWLGDAERRYGNSVQRGSDRDKWLSDRTKVLSGLYRIPDRSLMYGQVIMDWDNWSLGGSRSEPVWRCRVNFVRTIVALSTLTLRERLRYQIADIRERADEIVQPGKITDPMRNAIVMTQIYDLIDANLFCWQFAQNDDASEVPTCAAQLTSLMGLRP